MKTKIISILMTICLVLGIASAAAPSISLAAKKSIRLNKTKITLKVGDSTTLKAKTKPATLKKKVQFTSNKKKVAKVTKKGKVTAVAAGKAKITAIVKGTKLKATCKVTVTAGDGKDGKSGDRTNGGSNGVNGQNQNGANGQNGTNQNGQNGQNQNGTNPSDPNGQNQGEVPDNLVYPTKLSFDIDKSLATTERKVALVELDANNENVACINVEIGSTYSFKVDAEPVDYDKDAVEFKSKYDYVASVDQDGVVTGLYPGMTEISLVSKKDESVCARMYVKVNDSSQPDPNFKKQNNSINHGTIEVVTYNTDYRTTATNQARVWKPYDYDPKKEYDLVYCIHGHGCDMWYWTNDKGGTNDGCNADKILDNMYAEGLINDVIVVFPSAEINTYDANKTYKNVPADRKPLGAGTAGFLFEFELVYNLMPFIDKKYPIKEGPAHRAVCGLSQGGGQTYNISFYHPELFEYASVFSCSPFGAEDQDYVRSIEDAEAFNDSFKLFMLQIGDEDFLFDGTHAFEQTATKYGLKHSWVIEPGLGHVDAEWDLNLYKFMKYVFRQND